MNAVILAAGKSNRLAPFTYEKPKGLFCVKGEVLIERQIRQLKEAGITEIYLVVGYMKERFFYLESKFDVTLIVNNKFDKSGNLYSLYVARKYLGNTFICCADQYFVSNPFIGQNKDINSYRACTYQKGKFFEFAVDFSDADVITGFQVGGNDQMAMVGHAYFNKKFSERFCSFMEKEINDFGVINMFWEEFYARHQKELTLFIKKYETDDILEFDSIEDLRMFDSEFLLNVDSDIIDNICRILSCSPNEITDIKVIQAGLTNVSFMFSIGTEKYVYRHPGGTAGNLVDRKSEVLAQTKAKELEIDKSLIYIDESGWKISHYIDVLSPCDFNDDGQLRKAFEYLHLIHNIQQVGNVKDFDNVEEGKKLMGIASASKGNLQKEFAELIQKIERLDKFVKKQENLNHMQKVICHNDVYEPNYLIDGNGKLYLIDWEYAGLNNPLNDLACILCRGNYTDEQIEQYFYEYYGRKLTEEEHRISVAYIALCGFYWFCWGLYKGSSGDDDGFFFLPAYRNCIRFIDVAIQNYELCQEGNNI